MKTESWHFHSLRDQKTILALVCVLSVCFAGNLAVQDHFLGDPVFHKNAQSKALHFVVSINTAPKGELLLLPGIGETFAARIIEHRETVAPFECAADLELIRGIGEKRRAAIEPFVDFTLP